MKLLSLELPKWLPRFTGWQKEENFEGQKYEKLQFYPTKLVVSIANLYINLGDETEWRDAVVSDERSFSMDMVKVAAGILNKSAIPEDQITGTRNNYSS